MVWHEVWGVERGAVFWVKLHLLIHQAQAAAWCGMKCGVWSVVGSGALLEVGCSKCTSLFIKGREAAFVWRQVWRVESCQQGEGLAACTHTNCSALQAFWTPVLSLRHKRCEPPPNAFAPLPLPSMQMLCSDVPHLVETLLHPSLFTPVQGWLSHRLSSHSTFAPPSPFPPNTDSCADAAQQAS